MLTGKKSKTNTEPDQTTLLKKIGLFGVIVVDVVGYSGAGLAVGYFIWDKFSAPWWVLLVSSLAGLGLSFYKLYLFSQKDWK